jgi:hypothetical protein
MDSSLPSIGTYLISRINPSLLGSKSVRKHFLPDRRDPLKEHILCLIVCIDLHQPGYSMLIRLLFVTALVLHSISLLLVSSASAICQTHTASNYATTWHT